MDREEWMALVILLFETGPLGTEASARLLRRLLRSLDHPETDTRKGEP